MLRTTLPATASALAVLTVGLLIAITHNLGPLSAHMALHIALMNVIAPACLAAFMGGPGAARPRQLWVTAALQIVLLWAWHVPGIQRQVMESQALQWAMHASLFAIALLFWRALLTLAPTSRWQALPVLLFTGKLFCLLAVLLIFAPRLLYETPIGGHAAHANAVLTQLEDQQLAGLLMVIVCPLSYLVAGVIIAAQIMRSATSRNASIRPPAVAGS